MWWADSFRSRWKGLRPVAYTHGLLLVGNKIHGIGMQQPLGVAGLNWQGQVTETRRLSPRQWLWMQSADLVLELPSHRPLPDRGDQLQLVWLDVSSEQLWSGNEAEAPSDT